MITTSYRYQPFTYTYVRHKAIRLFSVKKDPTTSEVICTLRRTDYTEDYVALSYTWGASQPTRTIVIQDSEQKAVYHIGQNLHDFLCFVVEQPWGMRRALWVDQICIDQANAVERNQQVSIMNHIFKRARRVLVWLGCNPEVVAAARRLRDADSAPEDCDLTTLLRHPYFSRLWIVQEVALNPNIYIVCGEGELQWNILHGALRPQFNRGLCGVPEPTYKLIEEHAAFRTLQHCISRYCHNDCHDPRDKLYGLLGLTPERWRIKVDYEKSRVEVFLDAVAAFYEELFDVLEPESYYVLDLTELLHAKGATIYRTTLLELAREMKLAEHHLSGLVPFLHHVQGVYLNTPMRNIPYNLGESSTPSFPEGLGATVATRRNPLMRDVISAMGLDLAEQTAPDEANARRKVDRWWFQHGKKIIYYKCPPAGF